MESWDLDGSSQRLPNSVLTGVLGGGKTTTLNDLIQHPLWNRTRLLINELGIDHDIVTCSKDNVVIEMSGGSLCCTVRGDVAKPPRGAHRRGLVVRSRPLPEADGGGFCIERQGRPRCEGMRQ